MVASNPPLPSPLPARSPRCPSMRGQSPWQAMRDTCVTGAGARVLWPQMRMILYLFSSLRVATNFCSFFRSKPTFPAADALGFGGKEGVIIVIPKRRVTTPPWMPLAVQTCVVRRGGALVPVKRQLWAGSAPPARQEGFLPPAALGAQGLVLRCSLCVYPSSHGSYALGGSLVRSEARKNP